MFRGEGQGAQGGRETKKRRRLEDGLPIGPHRSAVEAPWALQMASASPANLLKTGLYCTCSNRCTRRLRIVERAMF